MKRLKFNDYAMCDGNIYFIDLESNLPCKLDVQTGKATYIEDAKNYSVDFRRKTDFVFCRDKEIVFMDAKGEDIGIYNVSKAEFGIIKMNSDVSTCGYKAYVGQHSENLYIAPRDKQEIIMFDSSNNLSVYSYINNITKDNIKCGCRFKDKIYLFSETGNWGIEYNIDGKGCKCFKGPEERIIHCATEGDKIFLLNPNGVVFCLNTESKEYDKMVERNNSMDEVLFSRIFVVNGKLILLPAFGKNIECIDVKSKKIIEYIDYPSDFKYYDDVSWSKYYGVTEDNENYYLLRASTHMLIINKKTGELNWKLLEVLNYDNKLMAYIHCGMEVDEKKSGVQEYIDVIKYRENNMKRNKTNIGIKIWNDL